MIKGVIFDLDGVIVDSPNIYFKVMKEFLENQNVKISDQEVTNLLMFSLKDEFNKIENDLD